MAISEKAYVTQLSNYLKAGDNEKAKETSKEFSEIYPKSFIAHFLHATACFRMKEYKEAMVEGKKAFFLSGGKDDMVYSAIVTGSALFLMGDMEGGRKFVSSVQIEGDEDLEKLKLAFAAVTGDAQGAAEHFKKLLKLNRDAARRMVGKILK